MSESVQYLVDLIFSLASFLFIARFLLQACRADFYNPLSQGIVKASDPVLKPMRMVVPGFRNLDFASFIAAWLAKLISVVLLANIMGSGLPSVGMLIGSTLIITLLFMLTILKWSIIIVIIISFISPGSYHPAVALLSQITEPILAPARKLLPPMGGLDFSPIIALAALHVLGLLLPDLYSRFVGFVA